MTEGYVIVNNNGGLGRCMAGVGIGGDKDIFEIYEEAVKVRDELRKEHDNEALEVYELKEPLKGEEPFNGKCPNCGGIDEMDWDVEFRLQEMIHVGTCTCGTTITLETKSYITDVEVKK